MASTHKGSLRVTRDLTVGTRVNLEPMTTVNRDALSAAFGDRIVNADTNTIEWFNGILWQNEILSQDHVLIECYQVPKSQGAPLTLNTNTHNQDGAGVSDFNGTTYNTFKAPESLVVTDIGVTVSTFQGATTASTIQVFNGVGTSGTFLTLSETKNHPSGSVQGFPFVYALDIPVEMTLGQEITFQFTPGSDVGGARISSSLDNNFSSQADHPTYPGSSVIKSQIIYAPLVPTTRYSLVSSTTDAGATIDQYAVNVDDVTDQPDISGGIPATWIPCP